MIFNTEEREAWTEFATARRHSGLPPTNSMEAFIEGYRTGKIARASSKWIDTKSGEELKNLLRYKGVPFYNRDSDEILRIKYYQDVDGYQICVIDTKDDNREFLVDIDTHGHSFESAIEYVKKYFPFVEIMSVTKKTYSHNGDSK